MACGQVIPVKVGVRVRPFSQKERHEGSQPCIDFYVEQSQLCINGRTFAFDYIFDTKTSQDAMFETSAAPLIKNIFKGYNCTVFAYGQTGSGKTYTMGTEANDSMISESAGIIPRVVQSIFDKIKSQSQQFSYFVKCSMLEIYEEKVIDLLSAEKGDALTIRESEKSGIFVQNLTEKVVSSLEQTVTALQQGCQVRSKGQTAMNLKSSRSHAIFTLFIQQVANDSDSASWQAKLNLVDLAGSERLKKTQASGERRKEGIKINEGLLALGNVISALTEPGSQRPHVPYRDSKLTRLLQDSLGGNSHTIMLACVSPADSNCDETMSTLRYAERAKKIQNKPIVNQDPQAAEIQRLKHTVQELRHQLTELGPGATIAATHNLQDVEALETAQRRITQLELENARLTSQVFEQVAGKAALVEKVTMIEVQREKLQERITEMKRRLGENINSLESSMVMSETDRGRQLEFMRALEHELPMLGHVEENEWTNKDDGTDDEDNEEDDEFEAKYVERQTNINQEMVALLEQIKQKEKLVEQTATNFEQMEKMRQEHDHQMNELEDKMRRLDQEKADLMEQLRRVGNSNKLSEQRRRRLKELENELSACRKKMNEMQKMEKLKNEADRNIQRLREEIQKLKQMRVQLVQQLKEESSKYRKWKQRYDRELNQLKLKERRREVEVVKVKRNLDQQLTVSKRKYEEAVACNRRLQEQLRRQAVVRDQKFTEMQENNKLTREIKAFLDQELELVAGAEEARLHCAALVEQRKQMTKELNKKRRQRKRLRSTDAPPAKRSRSSGEDEGEELQMLDDDIKQLEDRIELICGEISELQSQAAGVEQQMDNRSEQRWSAVRTIVHAKCALKQLFDMAVLAKVDGLQSSQSAAELKSTKDELNANLSEQIQQLLEMRKERDGARQELEQEMNTRKREHQTEMCFVLNQMCKLGEGQRMDKNDLEKISEIQSNMESMEQMQEHLAERDNEMKQLHQQLKAKSSKTGGGRSKLFRNVLASKDQAPVRIQRTRSSRLSKQPSRFGSVVSSEISTIRDESLDELSSGDIDSDYRETPVKRASKRKNSESEFCKCRGGCKNTVCLCSKRSESCSENCSCNPSFCSNRTTDAGTSSENHSYDVSIDSDMGDKPALDATFVKSDNSTDDIPVEKQSIFKSPYAPDATKKKYTPPTKFFKPIASEGRRN